MSWPLSDKKEKKREKKGLDHRRDEEGLPKGRTVCSIASR